MRRLASAPLFSSFRTALFALACVGPFGALPAWAGDAAARVVGISGKALIRIESKGTSAKPSQPLKIGDAIGPGATINTASDSSVKLLMSDHSIVDIGPSTLFKMDEYSLNGGSDRNVGLSMEYGKFRASVNQPVGPKGKFTVRTRSAVMGVRGTEFIVASSLAASSAPRGTGSGLMSSGATQITVVHGTVEVIPQSVALAAPGKSGGALSQLPPGQLPASGAVRSGAPVMVTAGSQLTTRPDGADGKIEAPHVAALSSGEIESVKQDAKQPDRTFIQSVVVSSSGSGSGGPATGTSTLSAFSQVLAVTAKDPPPVTSVIAGLPGTFTPDQVLHTTQQQTVGQAVNLSVVFHE